MSLYTAKQTSEKLGVTPRTLERWRSAGKFVPEVRTAGGHSRYSEEQISKALKSGFSTELQELLS